MKKWGHWNIGILSNTLAAIIWSYIEIFRWEKGELGDDVKWNVILYTVISLVVFDNECLCVVGWMKMEE